MEHENGHKTIFGLSVVLDLKFKNWAHLQFTYIKNQSYPNMSTIKIGLLFSLQVVVKKNLPLNGSNISLHRLLLS